MRCVRRRQRKRVTSRQFAQRSTSTLRTCPRMVRPPSVTARSPSSGVRLSRRQTRQSGGIPATLPSCARESAPESERERVALMPQDGNHFIFFVLIFRRTIFFSTSKKRLANGQEHSTGAHACTCTHSHTHMHKRDIRYAHIKNRLMYGATARTHTHIHPHTHTNIWHPLTSRDDHTPQLIIQASIIIQRGSVKKQAAAEAAHRAPSSPFPRPSPPSHPHHLPSLPSHHLKSLPY